MLVSVIIVNYNVKYFLEQCLYSVEKALAGVAGWRAGLRDAETEIIVVDNHSPDDSVGYLRSKFPGVRFIANEDNRGFARANNQGLALASGKYVLFLNPDTILPEDYFFVTLAFLEAMPRVGALGVRMVDGGGRFLPESRRGFPTLWVAFCKLSGLTALFPRSRVFARYYLGHLPEGEDHPAPVLSGACLLAKREALDRTGGFDERFFMYAEDIDLSYRLEQAGFTNYYLAEPRILHFKGESTRKDARYIRVFYKAMAQFRRKHFTGAGAAVLNGGVEAAIWLRAGVGALLRPFRSWGSSRSPRASLRAGKSAGYRTWVTGDPDTAAKLAGALAASGERTLVSGPGAAAGLSGADEIIFCEGAAFSFKACIAALSGTPPQTTCKIHAAGSLSAAGSDSTDGQGEVIVL